MPSNSDTMLSYSCPFEDMLSIYSIWLFDVGKWAIPEKNQTGRRVEDKVMKTPLEFLGFLLYTWKFQTKQSFTPT